MRFAVSAKRICDIVVITLLAVDQAIRFEVDDVNKYGIDWLEHHC